MVGFYDAVRDYIVYSLASTFGKLSVAALGQALRTEGTSLDNLVRPSRPCHPHVLDRSLAAAAGAGPALLGGRLALEPGAPCHPCHDR